MRGLEVCTVVGDFVVLDQYEAGDGGQEGDVVEGGVGVGSLLLLFGSVGWLEHEDALDEKEQGSGVEELEIQIVSSGLDCGRTGYVRDVLRRGSDHG